MSLLELWHKKNVPINRESNPFFNVQKEINGVFDSFFNDFELAPWSSFDKSPFSPSVDMTENDKEYQVTAELPGLDEKDVELSMDNKRLTIKGHKKEEKEEKEKNYYLKETSYGSFQRVLPLPDDVLTEKVEASFKKGVLKITLPKSEETKKNTKKIEIK